MNDGLFLSSATVPPPAFAQKTLSKKGLKVLRMTVVVGLSMGETFFLYDVAGFGYWGTRLAHPPLLPNRYV